MGGLRTAAADLASAGRGAPPARGQEKRLATAGRVGYVAVCLTRRPSSEKRRRHVRNRIGLWLLFSLWSWFGPCHIRTGPCLSRRGNAFHLCIRAHPCGPLLLTQFAVAPSGGQRSSAGGAGERHRARSRRRGFRFTFVVGVAPLIGGSDALWELSPLLRCKLLRSGSFLLSDMSSALLVSSKLLPSPSLMF